MKVEEFVANVKDHAAFYARRKGEFGLIIGKLRQAIAIIESQRTALYCIEMDETGQHRDIARHELGKEW